ncbi:MAG: ABC transporter permease [Eubacterium sp.]|nr:ABC transporter permease [Eubacterium sp.]
MTVFKTFFKVLKNYKISIIVYLSISIGVTAMLAGMSGSSDNKYSTTSHGLVVIDNDNSEISGELVAFLDEMNDIKEGDYTDEQVALLMYYTKISNYLVIPKGFGDAFKAGNTDTATMIESTKDAGSRMGYLVEAEIESYLNLFANYMKGGYSVSEAAELAQTALMDHSSVEMTGDDKETVSSIFLVFQCIPYGLLTLLFSAVLPVILRFNTEIINKRTNISATSNTKIQLSLAAAVSVVTLFIFGILTCIGTVMSKESFTNRWFLVLLDLAVFSLTVVMMIVALSNFRIKVDFAPGLTNIIGLSFCFLGGIFVPLEFLGGGAKAIGKFLPTYWYSEALARIKSGKELADIANCLLIQLLFGVMVMAIGLAVGKYNVKRAE